PGGEDCSVFQVVSSVPGGFGGLGRKMLSANAGETRYEKRLPHASVSGTPRVAQGTTPISAVHDGAVNCSVPAPAAPAARLPAAGHGSRPFAWANPMMASLIDSMLRWVSAELRTSTWVESGIRAPASRRAMIANATASSTSENPVPLLIAPSLGRNDHDAVVDCGGDAGPMLVDERRGAVCCGEVCVLQVIGNVSCRP